MTLTPELLQSIIDRETPYLEFCENFNRDATDPKTRRDYQYWCGQLMLDKTREEKIITRTKLEAAKCVLAMGHTAEEVALALNLPLADVKALL